MSDTSEITEKPREYGRLLPPYAGKTNCALDTCQRVLDEVEGAFVFTDLQSGKLAIVCGVCAADFELNHRDRFMLLML